jgi:hypothetical protein
MQEPLYVRSAWDTLSLDLVSARDACHTLRDSLKLPKDGEFFARVDRLVEMIEWHTINGVHLPTCRNACVHFVRDFVGFLDELKRATGGDASFRAIYNKEHLAFKQQWMRVLRSMMTFVRLQYTDDIAGNVRWQDYLRRSTRPRVDWEDVVAKVTAAEAEVAADCVAAASVVSRGKASTQTVKAKDELPTPHVLGQMRGLLGEI